METSPAFPFFNPKWILELLFIQTFFYQGVRLTFSLNKIFMHSKVCGVSWSKPVDLHIQ